MRERKRATPLVMDPSGGKGESAASPLGIRWEGPRRQLADDDRPTSIDYSASRVVPRVFFIFDANYASLVKNDGRFEMPT